MSLDRESLLARARGPRAVEPVEVPDGTVHARGLTGAEWDEYEAASMTPDGKGYRPNRTVLFRLAACDAGGEALFTAADDAALKALDAATVNPVCEAAQRLSGATKRAEADAGKDSPAP